MPIQHALQVFEYEDQRPFRIIDINGEPWFVLADVCAALELSNPSVVAKAIDDDQKAKLNLGSGTAATIINEPALYTVILRSRDAVIPGTTAYKFRRWVTGELLPSIRRTGGYGGNTPAFIRRANQNRDRLSARHFSVIDEITVRLWGRFEHLGHILADVAPDGKEIRPDISVGRGFSKWLSEHHPTVADNYILYLHWTPAKEVEARQYPRSMLPLFLEYLEDVWIPQEAERYFNRRDPAALPHIGHLLPAPKRSGSLR